MMQPLVAAAPTQQDVFKSISDNVGGSADPRLFYIAGIAAAGLVIVVMLANWIKRRAARPRADSCHHPVARPHSCQR